MSQMGFFDDAGLDEFERFASEARAAIAPGGVSWANSPHAWMKSFGPRTKSKMGRDIVRCWMRARGWRFGEGKHEEHFVVDGERVAVHFAIVGKNGKLEFAKLREPGMGTDYMLWLGVEPLRVRIWKVSPLAVKDLPTYKAEDQRYHHYALDPDAPPPWVTQLDEWPDRERGLMDEL